MFFKNKQLRTFSGRPLFLWVSKIYYILLYHNLLVQSREEVQPPSVLCFHFTGQIGWHLPISEKQANSFFTLINPSKLKNVEKPCGKNKGNP